MNNKIVRQIIKIDEEKCNGCGLCATACHEDAIAIVDGKAKLIRDDYCDGLGNCLPVCPTGAISFEQRETLEFDKEAVLKNIASKEEDTYSFKEEKSKLMQWPVQIKLAPIQASFFENANLLIAADCTAYAYASFHQNFMKNHVTLIGCPKLDEGDYSDKLQAILEGNSIKSLKIVRMEVPCCKGIEYAAIEALKGSGKMIPWQVVTITCDGKIKDL